MKTWSADETRILLENYNSVSNADLLRLIPTKTPQAIYKKAYKMGLRKSREIERMNRSEAMRGEKGPNWGGGTRVTKKGYRQVLMPGHHRADTAGYVMEHILIWEESTGSVVPDNCCVHHLNGVKNDNRIENLCLMERGAHTTFHHVGKPLSEATRKKISEKRRNKDAEPNFDNG